jgi:tetratricopeptide (TPR) repeat protein
MFLSLILENIDNKVKNLSIIILILFISIYGIRVFNRNIDWQTNHNLWVNSCQVSPNSHNAWNNIGDDYDKLAQKEETDEGKYQQYLNAIKGFTQSTVIKTNYADAYHNRGNIFYKIGRLDLARESYKTAVSFNPMMHQSYLSLIQIDILLEEYDVASQDLEILKKIAPTNVQVWYMEAYIDIKKNEIEKAKKILEAIVGQFPEFTDAVNLLKSISNKN